MNSTFARRVVGLIILLGIVGGGVLAVTQRYSILDWWALRDYTPPARVVTLADQTTMQDATRRVFYANHPELDDKTAFRERCRIEQSIVLGCYQSRGGIFLLDVTDPRLKGVIEVTAAHETLHAQYERLSSAERDRIDGLTADFLSRLTDERVRKTIEQYRASDPGVVPNELHSILGTEVGDLPPELEQYYRRYFSDRQKIVAFSEQYEQAFVELKDQGKNYDAQLQRLKAEIQADQAKTAALDEQLERQRSELNQLLSSGQTEAYNQRVAGFNALVEQYNALIGDTRALADEHNALVEKRNALITAEQELVQAVDTRSLPAKKRP